MASGGKNITFKSCDCSSSSSNEGGVVMQFEEAELPKWAQNQGASEAFNESIRSAFNMSSASGLNRSRAAALNQSRAAALNESRAAALNQSRAAALNQSRSAALNQSRAAALNQSRAAALNQSVLSNASSRSSTRRAWGPAKIPVICSGIITQPQEPVLPVLPREELPIEERSDEELEDKSPSLRGGPVFFSSPTRTIASPLNQSIASSINASRVSVASSTGSTRRRWAAATPPPENPPKQYISRRKRVLTAVPPAVASIPEIPVDDIGSPPYIPEWKVPTVPMALRKRTLVHITQNPKPKKESVIKHPNPWRDNTPPTSPVRQIPIPQRLFGNVTPPPLSSPMECPMVCSGSDYQQIETDFAPQAYDNFGNQMSNSCMPYPEPELPYYPDY